MIFPNIYSNINEIKHDIRQLDHPFFWKKNSFNLVIYFIIKNIFIIPQFDFWKAEEDFFSPKFRTGWSN